MRLVIYLLCIVSFLDISSAFAEGKKIIKIGTGNKDALAYPVLYEVCSIFNKYNQDKNISCEVLPTGGSEDNLNGIMSGKYDMGVIKADMQYNAYNGVGVFANNPSRDLRTLFGLHQEYLTILVKKDSKINNVSDFKGKRIYIGNVGSGSRILVDKLFKEIGFEKKDFTEVYEDQPDKIYDLFCQNKIDSAIYLVGHPNKIFVKTLKDCNVKLIGFSRSEIQNYIDFFPHISVAKITKNTYSGQSNDINTLASQLLLATSSNVDERIIYDFVQIIFEHQSELETKAPILKNSKLLNSQVNVIPFHSGAVRYYKTLN